MKKDTGFHEYVMNELFAEIPGISSRAMFGGWGVYQDGVIFALIDDGKVYFKVGRENQKDFEIAGSKPFEYLMPNGKTTQMSYWELPEEIYDEREEIKTWVEKAVSASKIVKKK